MWSWFTGRSDISLWHCIGKCQPKYPSPTNLGCSFVGVNCWWFKTNFLSFILSLKLLQSHSISCVPHFFRQSDRSHESLAGVFLRFRSVTEGFSVFFVIGQCNQFGFGFNSQLKTTLTEYTCIYQNIWKSKKYIFTVCCSFESKGSPWWTFILWYQWLPKSYRRRARFSK